MRNLFALVFVLVATRASAIIPAALVHTAVGAVAGSAGALAAYPIDYVKSQLQTEEGRAKYEGGFEAAVDICKNYGPLALYRGVMVNIVGVAPEKTVKLSANNFLRVALMTHFGYLPLAGEVIAGGFAGMTQVIVTNPLEVVKVKMQTSEMTVKEVMKQIHGLKDLYQGAEACIARDMVFSAVLFPIYAHAKVLLLPFVASLVGDHNSPAFWADLLAGSLSAGPAAFISTPADVVKTRIQQAREDGETAEYSADKGFFQVGREIVAEEGNEVLFSGWFERVVRSVPQFGVTLAIFDVLNTVAANHGLLPPQ